MDFLDIIDDLSYAAEAVNAKSFRDFESVMVKANSEMKLATKCQKKGKYQEAIQHCDSGSMLIAQFKERISSMSDEELQKYTVNVKGLLKAALLGLLSTTAVSLIGGVGIGIGTAHSINKAKSADSASRSLRNGLAASTGFGQGAKIGGAAGTIVVAIKKTIDQVTASRASMENACELLVKSFEAIKASCKAAMKGKANEAMVDFYEGIYEAFCDGGSLTRACAEVGFSDDDTAFLFDMFYN